jgi:hypothetical protein
MNLQHISVYILLTFNWILGYSVLCDTFGRSCLQQGVQYTAILNKAHAMNLLIKDLRCVLELSSLKHEFT